MNYRIERLNGDMQRVLADIIGHRIKDPRKTQLVGVTKVDIAKDLKTAKVYLSVLGDKDSALTTFNTVVRSTGFIKSELAKEFRDIRQIPDIHFILDNTSEYGERIDKILKEIQRDD